MSFFLKRMLHNWQILLTLALGVILGTSILASAPLLVDTVINFSLPYQLGGLDPLATNLRITTYFKPDLTQFELLNDQVNDILNKHLGGNIAQVDGLVSTTWLYPWLNDQAIIDQRLAISYYEALDDRVTFIAGSWPNGAVKQDNIVPVVISEVFANYYGLQAGDQLPVSTKQTASQPTAWLTVTGIIKPVDAGDKNWLGRYSRLQNQAANQWTAEFYAFIPKEQFFTTSEQLFPNARSRLDWHAIIDPSRVDMSDVPTITKKIDLVQEDLQVLPNAFNLETKLDQVLIQFFTRAQVIRVTMYVLIGEVLLLTLYYITMVASLSVQQIEGEFSTLSSRGASLSQLLGIQSSEAINIGILALCIGPLLGIVMVWSLAKFGPLADIAPAGWRLLLSPAEWMAAGFSVAICITGMILPASSAVKRSIVAYSRATSRTERPQWWQRVYLDVFVLVVGLLLLWRWRFYGSLSSGTGGGGRVDWLLILSPLVLLISSAIILLRVFPPILKLAARLAERGKGISTILALWQTSRNPAHAARLVLLLTLAMALGILTTGINATLSESEYERALYTAGSELRMSFNGMIPIEAVSSSSGVEAMSVVWRGKGSSTVRTREVIPTIDILAIEPFSFSKVTYYRDDYSTLPMGELLRSLASEPDPGQNPVIPLPGKPGRLGMWAYDQHFINTGTPQFYYPLDELVVYAKLQTSDGQLFLVKLNRLGGSELSEDRPGWNYFDTSLPQLAAGSYPIAFHSFWFTVRPQAGFISGSMDLNLDDFTVIDSESGKVTIFEGFDDVERIWQARNRNSRAAFIKIAARAHSGSAALAFSLPSQYNPFGFGLMPARGKRLEPMPALVSNEFLNLTKAEIGDVIRVNIRNVPMEVKISGLVNYFPTQFDSPGHAFMILPRDLLITNINREMRNPVFPNEVWINTANVEASRQVRTSIDTALETWDFDAERLILKADALLLGLRSVTFLAYILTTVLSLVGFATHFYLNARQREMQFSILRALGLSPGQMYTWLLLEQAIMIFTGLTLGMLFGVLLNRLILPSLPITIGDRPAIPPFLPMEDWVAVGRLYLTLLIAFIVSLGIATRLLWKANIHRALRIGQE